MTNERVMQLIREAYEKDLTELDLSRKQLTQLSPKIGELKNLTKLNLGENQLTQLPPEIGELKNLKELNLSQNQLMQLPPEIGKLQNLNKLDLSKNLLNMSINYLTEPLPNIGELKNLTVLDLSNNYLLKMPYGIGKLESLTVLNLSNNYITQMPSEIGKLKNLKELNLYSENFNQLPPEIGELDNLATLDLFNNKLTHLPPEIGKLKNLIELNLNENQLTQLPSEIGKLKNIKRFYLSRNKLEQLPLEITELEQLETLSLYGNPLTSPPPEIVSMGIKAIFTYLKHSKVPGHNEAKLILVGDGGVGKTCLANRLIYDRFSDTEITEGINISKWTLPSLDSEHSKIKLNIWDFGGQEIYHATHQFFLTTRSVYILVWNARRKKDYENIYYWLHTIEAFGGNSPIILVMSKMNESDDDLNLKELKNAFPQIKGYVKIDSKTDEGISILKDKIRETALNLSLMKTPWVNSWFKVREQLEGLGKNWITDVDFYRICNLMKLDSENISTLDGYLHELGVTLHFQDRLALKNIVILKPEWATNAFYDILSKNSVLRREGVLLTKELDQIWDRQKYPPVVHSQLMELMNKFELAYELPDKNSYLIPELLPKNEPDYYWDNEENLYFYYSYDSFLPSGIITRFIVRMHQDIEIKNNGMPLCWREGAVLNLQNSRALVKMKPDEKQIEIRITGDNKRGALGAICDQLDQIDASIKKINVSKQIPCNCSKNCPQRYFYEDLLDAEKANIKNVQCHKTYKERSISLLLDGYKRREERFREYDEFFDKPIFNIINQLQAHSESKSTAKAEQKTNVDVNVNVNVNIDLKIDLPQIQTELDNLKDELEDLDPKIDSDLDKIQDSLDELSPNSDKEKLINPLNKLYRFLIKLNDPDSNYNKVIKGTEKGIEYAQKLGRTYNKFAQWLAMPTVPDLFLGK